MADEKTIQLGSGWSGNNLTIRRGLLHAFTPEQAVLLQYLINQYEFAVDSDGQCPLTHDGFCDIPRKLILEYTGIGVQNQNMHLAFFRHIGLIETKLLPKTTKFYYKINAHKILKYVQKRNPRKFGGCV